MFCFDADERVTGDLRGFMQETHSSDCDGVRVELFDAYMTPDDQAPYRAGRELLDFRRYFGPERRDILMLWRNRPEVSFAQHLARACWHRTRGDRPALPTLWQGAFGRTLGRTCDYYIRHFPFDTYGRKWRDRRVRRSTPNPTSCGPSTSGATRSFANAVRI